MDDLLVGPDGTLVRVTALDDQTRVATVYNLTVNRIHTCYTLAGDTNEPLLVHNCGGRYVRQPEGSVTRSYDKFRPARTAGEMAGARYVKESGPRGTRSWMETYDHSGRVRIVHPKGGDFPHYLFDSVGRYVGNF